jgi:hypothetical protein
VDSSRGCTLKWSRSWGRLKQTKLKKAKNKLCCCFLLDFSNKYLWW